MADSAPPPPNASHQDLALRQQAEMLFLQAFHLAPAEQDAFVARACVANPELERELWNLLRMEHTREEVAVPFQRNLAYRGDPRFAVGAVLLDRFSIVRHIGRGGMGDVFEAQDNLLGRIALKTIRSEIASSRAALERFRREVELARKVSGPEICRIHDLFVLPAQGAHSATVFFTMEYLEGRTLLDAIRGRGPLPWKEVLPIALSICEGLRLIHRQGIVHCDLKSANIMLCDRQGESCAVLMDFGLATLLKSSGDGGDTGTVTGTPAYMAPEQFTSGEVSPATDIYAVGVILYEAMTGKLPFAAATPLEAAMLRAAHLERVSPAGFPRRCDRMLERCLAYEPERRYRSAAELARALRSGPCNFENIRADRPWVLGLAAVAILLACAWLGLGMWRRSQVHRPPAEAVRWYESGVAALREGANAKATSALTRAVAVDPGFVMAHARLAEAWARLDFDGKAQQEMLIASTQESHASELDRMYLEAIRAALTRDFSASLALYVRILGRLRGPDKAYAYIDIGNTYEQMGDHARAIENYRQAARLDPEMPAANMNIAVSESHQHHLEEAERAFERAEAIFKAEQNMEGMAELDWQRGYVADQRDDYGKARAYFTQALDEARRLQDVQLEIRALTQLSAVAYYSDHDTEAVELASRAIELGRQNMLNAWAAEGFIRLATAELDLGRYAEADDALQNAFQITRASKQDRIEAMANLTLASLRNQQDRPNQVAVPARAAQLYYQQHGYMNESFAASLLLARAERDAGDLQGALRSGENLLALARRTESSSLVVQAEELVGGVESRLENYPQALSHLTQAWTLAAAGDAKAYEAAHCAQVRWKLGDYEDAEKLLDAMPKQGPLATDAQAVRLELWMSERRFGDARKLALSSLASSSLSAGQRSALHLTLAEADAGLGLRREALEAAAKSGFDDASTRNDREYVDHLFAHASIDFSLEEWKQALHEAVEAQAIYKGVDMPDSQLRSCLLAAASARKLNDSADAANYSQLAVDIEHRLAQTWGVQLTQAYLARPDIRALK